MSSRLGIAALLALHSVLLGGCAQLGPIARALSGSLGSPGVTATSPTPTTVAAAPLSPLAGQLPGAPRTTVERFAFPGGSGERTVTVTPLPGGSSTTWTESTRWSSSSATPPR